MLRITTVLWLILAMVPLQAAPTIAPEKNTGLADEQRLRLADIDTNGPALLQYLSRRTLLANDQARIKKLIRNLGDDSFNLREKATVELVQLGRVVLFQLRQATRDPDLEISRRAERCIRQIEHSPDAANLAAIARLIALKKPPEAAAVLLGYLPHAHDDTVAEELRAALAAVAVRAGKPDKVLLAALTDPAPIRRGAAGEALCRAGVRDQLPAVRELLRDADPAVRLRAGLALVRLHEKKAIPVLIDLLGELSPEALWPVEDLLCRLADDQTPSAALGTDPASRKKCQTAWADWWNTHGGKIDLAALDRKPTLLGYTLVVLLDSGTIAELDKDNKQRWQFEGVLFPLDVQLLPGERVLLAEQRGNRVTERDRKGAIVWEKKFDAPLMAQRLPNGNTFMANRAQLLEVDRAGKEVFSYVPRDGSAIMRAAKLRGGDIACYTMPQQIGLGGQTQFVRLDSTGKELSRFPVEVATSGGRVEVLPNGHVLVPMMSQNKVVECDRTGKVVWELGVESPIVAVRLTTGNLLVTSIDASKGAIEFTRQGKEVWQYHHGESRVTRALRR